ncbi:CapA family protein [bacterium]|nr:CapA family protein [bacterium]
MQPSRWLLPLTWACALLLSRPVPARPPTLILLGDLQIHSRRADPRTALAGLSKELSKADLVYANLEGMLVDSQGPQGDIPDKVGWTHPGPGALVALRASGIAVVGLANNVAYGHANIEQTLDLLQKAGIAHVGAGHSLEEAHRPAILKRAGIRFGFLQYTARWYRADQQLAGPQRTGVAALHSQDGVGIDSEDLRRLQKDVTELRKRVDVVIVSQHNRDGATAVQYGPRRRRKNLRIPEAYQRKFAHLALDAGADLVYGHGTHCLQGLEIYRGRAILYSVGQSAFDQPGHEDDREGLLVKVSVSRRGVSDVRLLPLSRDSQNNVYILDPARGPGKQTLELLRNLSPTVKLSCQGHEIKLVCPAADLSPASEPAGASSGSRPGRPQTGRSSPQKNESVDAIRPWRRCELWDKGFATASPIPRWSVQPARYPVTERPPRPIPGQVLCSTENAARFAARVRSPKWQRSDSCKQE